jgi:hypothetical protein
MNTNTRLVIDFYDAVLSFSVKLSLAFIRSRSISFLVSSTTSLPLKMPEKKSEKHLRFM